MSDKSFKIVSDYCRSQGKGIAVRNYAHALYYESYIDVVDKHEEDNGDPPYGAQLENIQKTLLNESSLDLYVSQAEGMIRAAEVEIKNSMAKGQNKMSFLLNVVASVVGAFAYSLLVLAIYLVVLYGAPDWLDVASKKANTLPEAAELESQSSSESDAGDDVTQEDQVN